MSDDGKEEVLVTGRRATLPSGAAHDDVTSLPAAPTTLGEQLGLL
jgi:hypothetical protein